MLKRPACRPILDSDVTQAEAVEEDLYRKLRGDLERHLERKDALPTFGCDLCSSRLFCGRLSRRAHHNRNVLLDAVPFMQWRAEAEKSWKYLRNERDFLALCVAAMASALVFAEQQ